MGNLWRQSPADQDAVAVETLQTLGVTASAAMGMVTRQRMATNLQLAHERTLQNIALQRSAESTARAVEELLNEANR